jgi:uncharacterized glyoxalase superfamily protein PhnB
MMRGMKLTPHIVVTDADAAAAWYVQAFGAEERGRVPLPGGGVMSIELAIGDTGLHVAGEFPDAGIVSPATIGGTATVLQIETDDADALWARALGAGAEVRHELADQSGASATARWSTRSGIAGTSPSASARSRPRSSRRGPQRPSGAEAGATAAAAPAGCPRSVPAAAATA